MNKKKSVQKTGKKKKEQKKRMSFFFTNVLNIQYLGNSNAIYGFKQGHVNFFYRKKVKYLNDLSSYIDC